MPLALIKLINPPCVFEWAVLLSVAKADNTLNDLAEEGVDDADRNPDVGALNLRSRET